MQFTVPQIGRETKIIGPFTFKQFIYFAIAGAVCFIVYFTSPLPVFILVTPFLLALAFALAFLQIGGQTLPVLLKNFLLYLASNKIYLWKKKILPPKIIKVKREKKEDLIQESSSVKIIEKSLLKKLAIKIEMKTK